MRFLITGGCGFVGSNLAGAVLARGEELFVFDNLSRAGTSENLQWLRSRGAVTFVHGDIRSYDDVQRAVIAARPDAVFHLAGQVAMTTSLENPRLDFETNVIGGHNVLEAVRRHAPEAVVTYSSTNKVYGDLERFEYQETPTRYVVPQHPNGFDETLPLDFRTPYGCSKGAVDQYMLDYAQMYGLRTVVFRHSSMYGGRQFSTYDQGWIGWFAAKAVEVQRDPKLPPFTIHGSGKQVRDILYADDLISCYFGAIACPAAYGQAFNIGGGPINSFSILELFAFLERELGVSLKFTRLAPRQSDQKVYISDTQKANGTFGWKPAIGKEEGVRRMIAWVQQQYA